MRCCCCFLFTLSNYSWIFARLREMTGHVFLELGYDLAWVESFRTYGGAVHNRVTSKQRPLVLELGQALFRVLVSRVDNPSISWFHRCLWLVRVTLWIVFTDRIGVEQLVLSICPNSTSRMGMTLNSTHTIYIRRHHPLFINNHMLDMSKLS